MRRTPRIVLGAGLASACLLLAACGDASDSGPGFRRIVVVGVDGLRGDHLSRSGYPRATSPFLDALAERSVVFERGYSAASRGLTSYASLFTGRAPGEHDVWDDASPPLDESFPTLAEQLSERGYRTAAFVSTRRDWRPTGLTRGFDHFDAPSELFLRRYRRGGDTVARALAWLEAQPPGARYFVWVQLQDPNESLEPLPKPAAAVPEGPPADELVSFLVEQHALPLGHFGYENLRVLRLVNRYDGELRAADDAVGQLYHGLGAAGWGAGSLWIVTSPHGMGLGNHFWDGAVRQVHEVQVRVPLFFHAPGGELVPRSVGDVVSHLDLASTLLALSAGEEHALGGLLLGGERPPRAALVQRGPLGPLPSTQVGGEDRDQLDGVVEQRWKLLRDSSGAEQLYDVAEDPYETRDRRSEADGETLSRLREALAERLAADEER